MKSSSKIWPSNIKQEACYLLSVQQSVIKMAQLLQLDAIERACVCVCVCVCVCLILRVSWAKTSKLKRSALATAPRGASSIELPLFVCSVVCVCEYPILFFFQFATSQMAMAITMRITARIYFFCHRGHTRGQFLSDHYIHIKRTPKPCCAICACFKDTTKIRSPSRGTCRIDLAADHMFVYERNQICFGTSQKSMWPWSSY